MTVSDYQAIIGLEIHVQLDTKSKLFCPCSADVFQAPPNTLTCPVCSGQPGALPTLNSCAVELAILTALSLNCEISSTTRWDRKSYFYPDLPKGYQISQSDLPIGISGWFDLEHNGSIDRIHIQRVHLEEDAGKSIHHGNHALIDLNRAGVPLAEIVTEPDLRSPEQVYAFLTELRQILRYVGVSEAEMEKGAMRCEPNVSLMPHGAHELGPRTEIKNLNSLRVVRKAVTAEIQRQTEIVQRGNQVESITLGWDESTNTLFEQRKKETSDDYRYFPEPDLLPLSISSALVASLKANMPALPQQVKQKLIKDFSLSEKEVQVIVKERYIAEFFISAASIFPGKAKKVYNWITGPLFHQLRQQGLELDQSPLTPQSLVDIISMVETNVINPQTAENVLLQVLKGKGAPLQIIEQGDLRLVSDRASITNNVVAVLDENPEQVTKYRQGKTTIINWLQGQVVARMRGKADPHLIRQVLMQILEDES
ncbi:MAG: Asp-tRNA(Asn)/Glu-tRNA(Gln) amidotransferase subunit GatB [Chloroflexota bacterium]